MRVPAEQVRAQILSIFDAWGMDAGLARTAAEVMVETDLAGVDSHGVSMLMDYDDYRRRGKLNLKARPKVVRETAATALVDADAGLGHPAAVMAMELALKKAQTIGRHGDERDAHHGGGADARQGAGARHQPDRLRRAGEAQRAFPPRHGELRRREQQDQGLRVGRQAGSGRLGLR